MSLATFIECYGSVVSNVSRYTTFATVTVVDKLSSIPDTFRQIVFSLDVLGKNVAHETLELARKYELESTLNDQARAILSYILEKTATHPNIKPENQRSLFNDLPLASHKPDTNHTHPIAASARSTASSFIARLAKNLGLEPYFIQKSRADERHGYAGSRSYYWVKDVVMKATEFNPPQHTMLALVDVDYYVNMNRLLVENFQPVALYTLQPTAAARQTSNYSYTYAADGSIDYKVTGGSNYNHEIWNYGLDNLLVFKTFMGFTTGAAAYLVDKRTIDEDHVVVLFTPISRWGILSAWASKFLHSGRLVRLNPVQGDFVRLGVVKQGGVVMSTGRVGNFVVANIPAQIDDALAIAARLSKIDITPPMVASYIEGDKVAATVLTDFHRNSAGIKPPYVFPVEFSVRNYQFHPEHYDPDVKPSLIPFMSPLIHGCFAPMNCLNNEKACIKGRIMDVKVEEILITPFLSTLMDEFCDMLIPEPHTLVLEDDDLTWDTQSRATQRRIFNEAAWMLKAKRVIKMFIKKEAYQDVKDPRPISTINSVDKIDNSRIVYAFVNGVLKKQSWYAFSKNPIRIAERIAFILANASFAINTDFSRWDGHKSNVLRELERRVYLRAFRHEYRDMIIEHCRNRINLKAFGTFGTPYETGFAQNSGDNDTSSFNSVGNTFINFTGYRMTLSNGSFLSKQAAWDALGIYGGDDGLSANLEPRIVVKAALNMGQVLVADKVMRGEFGVKFLARVYSPFIWYGDLNSCCDLPRQLSKFHATVSLPPTVTALTKLREKATSFYCTDRWTPVMGDMVNAIVDRYGPSVDKEPSLSAIRRWGDDVDRENQYPNVRASWMFDYLDKAIPTFDYLLFRKWIDGCQVDGDYLSPPLCAEIPPVITKLPVVVDDDTVLPASAPVEKHNRKRVRKPKVPPDGNKTPRGRKQFNKLPVTQ